MRQRQDIDRLQAELSGASESNGSEILSKNRQLEELSQRADQVSVPPTSYLLPPTFYLVPHVSYLLPHNPSACLAPVR